MSEELKSAFEIEGFLEGKAKIISKSRDIYYFKDGKIIYCGYNGYEGETVEPIAFFLDRVWKPAPEPKPKLYRHHYWDVGPRNSAGTRYCNYAMVETICGWEIAKTWLNEENIFIKTEVVE